MWSSTLILGLLAFLAGTAAAQPAAPAPPPQAPGPVPLGNEDPVLRLEGQGPLSPVCASAFSPDGGTLYEAGWDKLVRRWKRDPRTGRFALDPRASLRIPIGPGDAGVMNALAVSADGRWLAVAGNAVAPEAAGFRQLGLVVPKATLANPWSNGAIYVFDLNAEPARCRTLAGHPGSVKALAFAVTPAGQDPLLLSAGSEPVLQGGGKPSLVLRLWDVVAQAERDRVQAGTYQGATPWLAAWSSPREPARIRVAAAWREKEMVVWDVGAGVPKRVADPFQGFSFTLGRRADGDEILTGHFGQKPGSRWPEGSLAAWNASAPASPVRSAWLSWAGADEKAIPVALALAASRPGGPRDLAAIVLRRWTPADGPDPASSTTEYRLQLVDLAPGSFGSVKAQVPLWSGPLADPLISAAADGRQLAIVGHPENEIHVHDVGRLLENQGGPQRLRGVGDPVGVATFVKRGADWGLRLRRTPAATPGAPPPPLGPDDAVFDLGQRRLAPTREGWSLAVAAPGAWQSRLVPPRREPGTRRLLAPWTLWLYENGKAVGRGIALTPESRTSAAEDLRVTDYALLPPQPGFAVKEPVAAVALYEPGVGPTLWLYNGRTGERVRQLSGHTGTIRSVAFSADGRLLVSAGDDRTACVWSLTDLDRVVHVRGALSGLVLASKDGRLVVSDYAPEPGRNAADLRAGDVLEGLVEGGRLVVPGAVHSLHFTASDRKPGQALTLRRRRGGEPPRDVTLVLGQAADERKPLFTLFLARTEKGEGRDWLAWNPFGPYDASGPAVESLFGWHFNAFANPAEPARFALASQYPQFRRENLLRDLVAAGRLVLADPEPPIARPPVMELFLDPAGETDPQGRRIVHQPPSVLGLSLDDAVPAARIRSVTWQLDDEGPRPMRLEEPDWSADLAAVPWDRLPRGVPHRLTVVLTTNERSPQRFTAVQRLLYLPRPRVSVRIPQGLADVPAAPILADHRKFRVAADVEPARNAKALVTLTCRNGETVVFRKAYGPLDAPLAVDETIELKPGANKVTIEARSADGLAGLEEYETARFGPLTVQFHPDPTEPPAIGLDALALLSRGDETVPIAGADRVAVEVPRVRLKGEVRSKDEIVSVERSEDGRAWNAVETPPARGARSYVLGEVVDLVPERPTTLHIRARTVSAMGVESSAVETLRIEYRPALPTLEGLAVDRPGPLVVPGTDGEPAPLLLSARVVGGVAGGPPVEAAVLLGDDVLADPPALDLAAGTFSARVRPRRGRNEIRVRLKNRWHTAVVGPVFVDYRRPPKVETVEANVQGTRPSASVSAFVVSQTALTGADVEVAAPSRDGPRARIALEWKRDAGDLWLVSGTVPLEPGENTLIVRTRNEDGPSAETRRSLRYEKPVPPKPEIGLVDTPEAASVSRPRFVVRFVVRSTTPLERVELVREPSGAPRALVRGFQAEELRQGTRQAGDVLEWTGEAAVTLDPTVNAFRIVAVNAGGEASKALNLTYTCPPVRVEDLEVVARAGPATPAAGGRAERPAVPEGRALLRGQVVWIDQDPQRVREVPRVQVWVNGFPQVAAELGTVRTRGREQVRDFRAEVLLSKAENQVEVKLRDLPLEIQGQPSFPVACLNPDRNFQLHLLVISIGTGDEPGLRRRAIDSLKGREVRGNEFVTPAFSRARMYGPHCPKVARERINGELFRIRRSIRMDTRASNEVVMLFYQGEETFDDREPSLRLSASNRPGDVYRLSDIRQRLEETRGAKLFLLDVTHASEQAPQVVAETGRWIKEDGPFGLLRFSWPGQAAPPADANLAATLREAVQDAVTLGQVNAKVKERAVALRQQFPGALYAPELTPMLEALVIGGP